MNHLNDTFLNEYLDQQLDPAAHERISVHLAGCSECRERLAEMEQLFTTMANLPEVPLMTDLSQRVVARISAEFKPRPIPRWTFPVIVLQLVAVLVVAIWLGPSMQPDLDSVGRNFSQTAEQLMPNLSLSEVVEPLLSGIKSLGELGEAVGPDAPLPILEGFLIIGLALIVWLAGSGLILSRSFVMRNNRG